MLDMILIALAVSAQQQAPVTIVHAAHRPLELCHRRTCVWRIVKGEPILRLIALRKWTESQLRDAPNGNETIGSAKRAAAKNQTPDDFIPGSGRG